MIFAPHILLVKVVSGPSFDEDMNPLPRKRIGKTLVPAGVMIMA